jgi:hypothetical protein
MNLISLLKRAFKEPEDLGGAGCNDVNSKYVPVRDEEEKLRRTERRKEGRKKERKRNEEEAKGRRRGSKGAGRGDRLAP